MYGWEETVKYSAIKCVIGILTVADAECQPLTEASRSHRLAQKPVINW